MNILFIGDVVGNMGCMALIKMLPKIKREYNADLTIVNGENSAEGNGILPSSMSDIFSAGADVITGGNHTLRRKEIHDYLETNDRLLRPHNLAESAPGKGYTVVDFGKYRVAVINLMGEVYLSGATNPFSAAESLINTAKNDGAKVIFIDFHAEATSEKKTMLYFLDGTVSAIAGTHTHIATADSTVTERGTGYITDVGMCGTKESVLGIKPEIAIAKMKAKEPVKFVNAKGAQIINGICFTVDEKSGKCTMAKRINYEDINI